MIMCSRLNDDITKEIRLYLNQIVRNSLLVNGMYFAGLSSHKVRIDIRVSSEEYAVRDLLAVIKYNQETMQRGLLPVIQDQLYVKVYSAIIDIYVENSPQYRLHINDVYYGGKCILQERPFCSDAVRGSLSECLKRFKTKPKYW